MKKSNAMKLAGLRAQGRCWGWALIAKNMGMVLSSDFAGTEDEARAAYDVQVHNLLDHVKGSSAATLMPGAYVVLVERVSARRLVHVAESLRKSTYVMQ